ncbi:S4 domain-containing protein [Vibrio parahaemolyticus]
MSQDNAKRLNKFISETGFCSRRAADKLIEEGRVTINGKQPEMGTKVLPGDDVCVDGKPVASKEKPIYIALNKPTGITCTTERVDKPITDEFLKQMSSGVRILDTVTLPCKVTKETKFSFRIVLTQGLNRQIRRMCEALGYEVFKLRRVRIMNISLDGIPNGKWRYLTDDEVAEILAMCDGSVGTEEASKTDSRGRNIRKATDAKLFDSREENQGSTARRNQKTRTFRGNNADEFRHAPNSKKGQQKRRQRDDENSRPAKGHYKAKPQTPSKPKQHYVNPNTTSKPAKRTSGTLSLKK